MLTRQRRNIRARQRGTGGTEKGRMVRTEVFLSPSVRIRTENEFEEMRSFACDRRGSIRKNNASSKQSFKIDEFYDTIKNIIYPYYEFFNKSFSLICSLMN